MAKIIGEYLRPGLSVMPAAKIDPCQDVDPIDRESQEDNFEEERVICPARIPPEIEY